MKEEIQSIQLVINLLGKLLGQMERKKTYNCCNLYNPISGREEREKLPEKLQIKTMFDKIEDIKRKKNVPQPNPTEVVSTNGKQDFLPEAGFKKQTTKITKN